MPAANFSGLPIEVIDAAGHVVVPGFVDIHEHITGGGGEAGPASRTPEAQLSEIIAAGVTTVVGTLGTDCVSRSLENLRAKVAALEADGLHAHMWVGCYRVPSPTLTGSLVRDMTLVVGAGEVAVSDHRSSWPSTAELLSLAADARVGGMLIGKRGVLHLHVGDAPSLLGPLWAVVNATGGALPMTHLLPTHVSLRGPALLADAARWVRQGGHVDFTADQAGENASVAALLEWRRVGVPLSGVSLSSDAFGSLPEYDSAGRLVRYGAFSPASLLATVRALVLAHGWAFPTALQLVTRNPAHFLGLLAAGRVEAGLPGDVLVLREADLALRWSFARGKKVLAPGWVKKGMFEK
ncbi:hypothetical protein KFL_006040030 [Klebsormidium nitens]|uniref:dihydropyrimidinase n=1 Tax=Klebsormidium nitens TaxID=105231 RepID=A0A1Y1ILV9_KLENI|nr:hypothetical protein KFL_006040030 [Klebsormidium nitens]|eukprot:GAQ90131.1 hypothetical protein KFL_006040030 [Klebsormidium nitens]